MAHAVQKWARYAPELGWRAILAVLDEPDASQHTDALAHSLSMLVAQFGDQFIEQIEAEAAISFVFRSCLGEIRSDPVFMIPESLWPRLSRAAGAEVGPMAPHMAKLYAGMPSLATVASFDPRPLHPEHFPALTDDELREHARAWIVHEQCFWAWDELQRIRDEEGCDATWSYVVAIVEQGSDEARGQLGAGIVEDLLRDHGPAIIERVEAAAAASRDFRYCLSHVWRGDMPDDLWARVEAARGDEPQRG